MKYKVIKALSFFLILTSVLVSYRNIPDSFVLYKDKEWSSGSISDLIISDSSVEVSRGLVVAKKEGNYQAALSLFGIPYKEVTLKVIDNEEVFLGGQAIGIRLFSDGLMVIATGRVNPYGKSPAEEAGICEGDIITKINSEKIKGVEDFSEKIEKSDEIRLEIKRGEETFEVGITPQKSQNDGVKRIGLWVRDSTAGVGTLTYVSPRDNTYGALGHAISDSDTGKRFDVLSGSIEECRIGGVVKGERGVPGELRGVFFSGAKVLGDIKLNKKEGVFGRFWGDTESEKVPLGHRDEIKKGKALIRTSIDGKKIENYEIEILKVSKNTKNPTKGMVIKITDERLIEKTGGIVQGMSGSPIVQDGKLIGAVTHVLVNDPTKGYGIFIENMLSCTK